MIILKSQELLYITSSSSSERIVLDIRDFCTLLNCHQLFLKHENIENLVTEDLKSCSEDPEEFERKVNGACIILDKWVLHYVETDEMEIIIKLLRHLKE